jgi:uncharacterized protein YtpQ (UPF0354 family)
VVGQREILLKAPDGREFRAYLDNAWAKCSDDPSARVPVCTDHIASIAEGYESGRPAATAVDANSIVPVLKSAEVLAQFPVREDGAKSYIAEPFAGDIWIVYARDMKRGIAYLLPEDLPQMHMGLGDLRQVAVRNLGNRLPPVKRYGGGPVFMMVAGGDYEASLLLLDDIWDAQQEVVDGDILVAVPCRDLLVMTGTNSVEGKQKMHMMIDDAWQKGIYPVSKSVLLRKDHQWQVYRP